MSKEYYYDDEDLISKCMQKIEDNTSKKHISEKYIFEHETLMSIYGRLMWYFFVVAIQQIYGAYKAAREYTENIYTAFFYVGNFLLPTGRTNDKGIGSNSGRLYTHTDTQYYRSRAGW